MIEYETTTLAVQDLEKYFNALDQALMKYHGMKVGPGRALIPCVLLSCFAATEHRTFAL